MYGGEDSFWTQEFKHLESEMGMIGKWDFLCVVP